MTRRRPRAIDRTTAHAAILCFLVAGTVAIGFINAHVKGYILDETIIKQSAVHYTTNLPSSLFDDVNARATSRLYSLLMAPLFAIGVGDVAVRSARALNAVLFASAALPVYLLAGFAFTGRSLTRAVVAVLAVFLPWVVLTSAMFTESLAYPLFLWAAYALTRLYVKPSPGSDVFSIVVIALATVARTQLIALGIAYLVVVLMRTAHDLRTPGVPWYVAIDRLVVRRMPGAIVLAAGTALGLVWLSRAGTLSTHLNSLLGTYASTTTDQRTLPRDIGLSTGVELIGMAAGTGVLPVVAGVSWLAFAVRGKVVRAWSEIAFARVAVVIGCVLFATTLYSQSFYLGSATEERYYFYVAPLLIIAGWRGALGRLFPAQLAAGSVVIVACAALLPLPRSLEDPEANFFAPGLATAQSTANLLESGLTSAVGRGGLGSADLVAAMFALVLGITAVLRRCFSARGEIVALGFAAALQIIVTVTCVLSVAGAIPGIVGRTDGPSFAQLGFADRGSGGDEVTWLDNQPKVLGPAEDDVQRRALLYNDRIVRRASISQVPTIPDNFPLSSLPIEYVGVNTLTGRLRRVDFPVPLVDRLYVQSRNSPLSQLAGRRIRSGPAPDGLELVMTTSRPGLRWAAEGLDGAGRIARRSASLHSWGAHRTEVAFVEEKPGSLSVRWRGDTMRLDGGRRGERRVELPGCGSGTGRIATAGQIRLTRVIQLPC